MTLSDNNNYYYHYNNNSNNNKILQMVLILIGDIKLPGSDRGKVGNFLSYEIGDK